MSAVPNTVRVHQALARSYPVPMEARNLCVVLELPVRSVQRALACCIDSQVVRRVGIPGQFGGYGYTVDLT